MKLKKTGASRFIRKYVTKGSALETARFIGLIVVLVICIGIMTAIASSAQNQPQINLFVTPTVTPVPCIPITATPTK